MVFYCVKRFVADDVFYLAGVFCGGFLAYSERLECGGDYGMALKNLLGKGDALVGEGERTILIH